MRNRLLLICALIFIIPHISAQTNESGNKQSHNIAIAIPDVALIGIAGPEGSGSTINLTPNISNLEAGEAVDFSTASDNSLWLNYTSIVENKGNGKERKITVEIDQKLPNGLDILLEVAPTSTGNGETGIATQEKIILKKGPQTVVENIGSCYTENGEGKGHRLTYSLDEIKDNQFNKVMAETFSVQVLYTITGK